MTPRYGTWRSDEGVRQAIAVEGRKWVFFVVITPSLVAMKQRKEELEHFVDSDVPVAKAARKFKAVAKHNGMTAGAKRILDLALAA